MDFSDSWIVVYVKQNTTGLVAALVINELDYDKVVKESIGMDSQVIRANSLAKALRADFAGVVVEVEHESES